MLLKSLQDFNKPLSYAQTKGAYCCLKYSIKGNQPSCKNYVRATKSKILKAYKGHVVLRIQTNAPSLFLLVVKLLQMLLLFLLRKNNKVAME